MVSCGSREKILIHLQDFSDFQDKREVPYQACQAGIAEEIDLSQTRVSRLIRDMLEESLVKEDKKRIVGLRRKRKVYSLTPTGYEKSEDILEDIRDEEVKLKLDQDTVEKVRLSNVDNYIDTQNPLLTALNELDKDDVVDLTHEDKGKKDIFVGREEEMDRLKEILDEVEEEGSSVLFVSGEAGIGKTTLVMEFKRYVTKKNFQFLVGNSYYDSSDPYLPFKEAFEDYVWPSKKGEKKAEKGEKVSFASEGGPKVEDQKMFNAQRQSAFHESTQGVKNIASKRPLVVFLDDLQWSDKATLELFHYMAIHLEDSPVFFIGSYRPEEVSKRHPLKEIQRRMSREKLYEEFELDPLTEQNTAEIIKNIVGREDLPDRFVKLLHEKSEGNPLFLRECVEQMLEDGTIEPKEDRYPTSAEDVTIPSLIKDIVARRIESLDRETKKLLQLGSVIGEKVPFSLLMEAMDKDELDIMEQVDILQGADLWGKGPKEEKFHFTHELVQMSVYEDIATPVRRALHKKVARAMESVYSDDLEDHYSELGFHFREGGAEGKAADYYRRAGQEAEEVYAHDDSIEMYQKALELVDEGEQRFELLEKLGAVYQILGEYDEARARFDEALDCADRVEKKQRIYLKIGSSWEKQSRYEKALEVLDKALDLSDEETIERARLLSTKGKVLMRLSDYDEASEMLERAKTIAEDVGDKKEISQTLHDLGTIQYYRSGDESALDYFNRALDIRKEIDDIRGQSATFNNLGVLYEERGDLDKALDYHRKSERIKEKIGDKRGIAFSLNNIGLVLSSKGELDEALEHYKDSMEISRKLGDKFGTGEAKTNIAFIYLQDSKAGKALEYFQESLKISKEIGDKLLQARNLHGLAETQLELDNLEGAERHAKEAIDIAKEIGSELQEGLGKRAMGLILEEKEDLESADRLFEEAEDLLEAATDRKELATLYEEYAYLCEEKDETDRAKQLIERAESMYRDMGIESGAERCEEIYDSID